MLAIKTSLEKYLKTIPGKLQNVVKKRTFLIILTPNY